MKTKLYLLMFDGQLTYVEAESFARAIELWKQVKRVEWGEYFQDGDEPETCALVHDEPVVREGWLARQEAEEEAILSGRTAQEPES